MNLSVKNINKPSPPTFLKIKKAIGITFTFIISLLLVIPGFSEDSLILLIIKLGQSFIMEMLDLFAGAD
jgi:hypothetical protein